MGDAFDRRVLKHEDTDLDGVIDANEPVERYIWDGDEVVLTLDATGNVTHRFLHGPEVDQVFADETAADGVLWYLTDNLHSVRDVVDSTGTVVNHLEYSAFGRITSETDSDATPFFAYTGREWDEAVNLQYNRRRWYDPSLARWISEDPIRWSAGDPNLYRYVENDPINRTDPSGLKGHHWVPQSIIRDLGHLFVPVARGLLEAGTTVPEIYDHGYDTWDTVSHPKYNQAVRQLIEGYSRANGGPITEKQARDILEFLEKGLISDRDPILRPLLKRLPPGVCEDISRWRAGFFKSIGVGRDIMNRASAKNMALTKEELKHILQNLLSGDPDKYKLPRAHQALVDEYRAWLNGLSKAQRAKWSRGVLAGGILGILATGLNAAEGAQGRGKLLAAGLDGWEGALVNAGQEWARDLVFADEVETYLFPLIRSGYDVIGNAIGGSSVMQIPAGRGMRGGIPPRDFDDTNVGTIPR